MQFTPKDESVIEQEQEDRKKNSVPWPKGEYDFEIAGARDVPSKGYIELDVVIFDQQGAEKRVTDWLTPKAMYKLLHFCQAAGFEDKYHAGNLSDIDCVGITGKCYVKVEKGKKKENGDGFFPDQNRIGDYLKPSTADDIPF